MPMDCGCGIERCLRVFSGWFTCPDCGDLPDNWISRIAGWLGAGREIDVEAVFFCFDGGLGF